MINAGSASHIAHAESTAGVASGNFPVRRARKPARKHSARSQRFDKGRRRYGIKHATGYSASMTSFQLTTPGVNATELETASYVQFAPPSAAIFGIS